jgi:hypothetical protein
MNRLLQALGFTPLALEVICFGLYKQRSHEYPIILLPRQANIYISELAFELPIDWSDGRVVMALVSGSPEMSLLVRNRVGSNPTLIIILLFVYSLPRVEQDCCFVL